MTFKIAIISGSVRINRQTPKAVSFLASRLLAHDKTEVKVLDLNDFNFPVMEERLGLHPTPPSGLDEFGSTLKWADAIVLASPEYNGSYSGALKNAIDYFREGYAQKVFGVLTVSAGRLGGVNASHHLQSLILSIGGFPIPKKLMIPNINESIDEVGNAEPFVEKTTEGFISQLLFLTQAVKHQQAKNKE